MHLACPACTSLCGRTLHLGVWSWHTCIAAASSFLLPRAIRSGHGLCKGDPAPLELRPHVLTLDLAPRYMLFGAHTKKSLAWLLAANVDRLDCRLDGTSASSLSRDLQEWVVQAMWDLEWDVLIEAAVCEEDDAEAVPEDAGHATSRSMVEHVFLHACVEPEYTMYVAPDPAVVA